MTNFCIYNANYPKERLIQPPMTIETAEFRRNRRPEEDFAWHPHRICMILPRVTPNFETPPAPMATAPTPPARKKAPNPPTLGGRLFLMALGLILASMGALFVWLMARSFLRAREMRSWPEVPCVILTSETEERRHDPDSPAEFRQDVSFGYEWKGEKHTGDHLTLRGSPWSSQRAEIEQRTSEFPAGKMITCRVDPAHPDFAVLKPDSLAPGYSIWFPSLFVIGGLGIAWRALRRSEKTQF